MDREISARSREFELVRAWIIDNLDQPLTVERIAKHAGLSAYHFSRLFTIHMGRSVMTFVRHLRLVDAAKRIATQPELKLMDLALESGFQSQEAFTRAFKRTFGVSPGRLHVAYHPKVESYPDAYENAHNVGIRVEQLPELLDRESFTVVGVSHSYDDETRLAIPGLRKRLIKLLSSAARPVNETYGVIFSEEAGDGSFRYMAAAPSKANELPIPGLEKAEIPACRYLVFRITLAAGPAHPQIRAALKMIWDALLPASGLLVRDAPDFEQYGPDYISGKSGSALNYHVAVHAGKESAATQ